MMLRSCLRSLAGFAPSMVHCADELATALGGAAESGQPVDFWRLTGHMTLDSVGATVFGCSAVPQASLEAVSCAHLGSALRVVAANADSVMSSTRFLFTTTALDLCRPHAGFRSGRSSCPVSFSETELHMCFLSSGMTAVSRACSACCNELAHALLTLQDPLWRTKRSGARP